MFRDGITTALAPNGAILEQVTPDDETRLAIAEREGGTEWRLRLGEDTVRIAYGIGSIPGARCSSDNVASRRTLQKAGFVPYAHILHASIPMPLESSGTGSRLY